MNLLYGTLFIENFYLTFGIIFLAFLIYWFNKTYHKLIDLFINPKVIKSVDLGNNNNLKKLDSKCYNILYGVYNMIGANIDTDNSEIFDEKNLNKLDEAKKIFFGVKKNKNLIKSNYMLIKILKKIKMFNIETIDLNDTIIFLIVLVLNKKNK